MASLQSTGIPASHVLCSKASGAASKHSAPRQGAGAGDGTAAGVGGAVGAGDGVARGVRSGAGTGGAVAPGVETTVGVGDAVGGAIDVDEAVLGAAFPPPHAAVSVSARAAHPDARAACRRV